MDLEMSSFVPFTHQLLEVKNNIIQFARNQKRDTTEGQAVAVLFYVNIVDYLAGHLLGELRKMTAIATYRTLNATLSYTGKVSKNRPETLGQTIGELECYDFPDKEGFLKSLREFNKLRISVIHSLMEIGVKKKVDEYDAEINRVPPLAEEVIAKYNLIVTGITVAWNNAYPAPIVPKAGDEAKPNEVK